MSSVWGECCFRSTVLVQKFLVRAVHTDDVARLSYPLMTRTSLFCAALTITAAVSEMHRVRTQFIAALGDPAASEGVGAKQWGIWRVDPGPRGIRLSSFSELVAAGGVAPSGWTFDPQDFWLEEHGLVMEKPDVPLPPGKYLVTGDREVTTVLNIAADGDSWKLDTGTMYDVTHLPCRSARYHPITPGGASPADARAVDFPVKPGGEMPNVRGCTRQDCAIVFVVAVDR